jgi:hypothetical protein
VNKRYEAYNWHVQTVADVNNTNDLLQAIENAKLIVDKPSIIKVFFYYYYYLLLFFYFIFLYCIIIIFIFISYYSAYFILTKKNIKEINKT